MYNLNLFFAAGVRETLEAAGFYEKIDKNVLYLTVHDAVLAAFNRTDMFVDHEEEVGSTISISRVYFLSTLVIKADFMILVENLPLQNWSKEDNIYMDFWKNQDSSHTQNFRHIVPSESSNYRYLMFSSFPIELICDFLKPVF